MRVVGARRRQQQEEEAMQLVAVSTTGGLPEQGVGFTRLCGPQRAHAAPQGMCDNLIDALKLLAKQQMDGDSPVEKIVKV